MTVKMLHDVDGGELPATASDWIREFLKNVELNLVDVVSQITHSGTPDYAVAAMRAVRLTLLDAGLNEEQFDSLIEQVKGESVSTSTVLQWNAELNKRRFELIDGDIQGSLSPAEQRELANLTRLMRVHLDTEANFPFEDARKLHRHLLDLGSKSADAEQ